MNIYLFSLALIFMAASLAAYYEMSNDGRKGDDFEKWKGQFAISFDSSLQDNFRKHIFYSNLQAIRIHNGNPKRTYDLGLNQFTGLTQQQFAERYLTAKDRVIIEDISEDGPVQPLTAEVDWTTQGAVSQPKNQGQCGAGWAFACAGSLEGLSKIGYGTLKVLSQQQLIDCTGPFGNHGCSSGIMENGFKFVKEVGICSQDEYPYRGAQAMCQNCSSTFKISGYTSIRDCYSLSNAIVGRPVAVTVDAANWAAYKSGVFDNCRTSLSHAVLLVGMVGGAWKIKNSWGTSWGQAGYIRLAAGNTCGVCIAASYPLK